MPRPRMLRGDGMTLLPSSLLGNYCVASRMSGFPVDWTWARGTASGTLCGYGQGKLYFLDR